MMFVKLFSRRLMFPLVVLMAAMPVFAQTSAFTYQGRLTDNGLSANGAYQFEFKLFDALTNGNQIGSTITDVAATVTAGIFTVQLDFGAAAFNGGTRYLEIGVRMNGSPNPYTLLSPRQSVTSTPYAIRSVTSAQADNAMTATNSTQLGGIAASQYVQTTDGRMTDARNPLPFSANYIQNRTSQQLGTSNFNISGSGTADTLNALTEYRIQGERIFGIPGNSNTFAGLIAGASNTSGAFNTFLGRSAGNQNLGGGSNTFVGALSGESNAGGNGNSFFGSFTGRFNTGGSNSFFGSFTGGANLGGGNNSFFGQSAGSGNTSGSDNTFLGTFAGSSNTTGFRNTIIGFGANVGSNNLTNATAIGYNAVVNTSNTMVLGTNIVNVQVPGDLAVTGALNAAGTTVTNLNVTGTLTANGSGLTNLNANNITAGTLSSARLGVVPIANGGTGSATRNFVDLTTGEFIGGSKSFSNAVNTSAQYNILGQRVLGASADLDNLFVGIDAGLSNAGTGNSFAGDSAGRMNSSGQDNSFFGRDAGDANTTGHRNSFFGVNAGGSNISGLNNAFFGNNAGNSNTIGDSNTVIGNNADVGSNDLTNATAIGAGAVVNSSNTVVLGTNAETVNVPGTFNIGGGGQIARMRTTTATHDFPPVFYNQDWVVQVTGAQLNDVVLLGLPDGFSGCCLVFTAWVSSPGFVTIRVDNTDNQGQGAINPPSATYRILVVGF